MRFIDQVREMVLAARRTPSLRSSSWMRR